MTERIHDDEPDVSEATVRALLGRQCPGWAARPVRALATSGTDNAMWRVDVADGPDVVVRLPRRLAAARGVAAELEVLQRVADSALAEVVATPRVRHVGRPEDVFPYDWSVLEWVDGDDAWSARDAIATSDRLAVDVAATVQAIGDLTEMPVPRRGPGERGGPIAAVPAAIAAWLSDPQWSAPALLDVAAVNRVVAEAIDAAGDEPVTETFTHGDLIPGNLLVADGRLVAVIDWGSAGIGDPAQDLAPAWSVFDARRRREFRAAVGATESAWQRARLFELLHAVAAVLYYVPRRHPLGDVMSRTLHRLLTDE